MWHYLVLDHVEWFKLTKCLWRHLSFLIQLFQCLIMTESIWAGNKSIWDNLWMYMLETTKPWCFQAIRSLGNLFKIRPVNNWAAFAVFGLFYGFQLVLENKLIVCSLLFCFLPYQMCSRVIKGVQVSRKVFEPVFISYATQSKYARTIEEIWRTEFV